MKLGLIGFVIFRGLLVLQLFRIGERRGDYVAAAGPLAEINQAAAITAKRKVLITGQHQCPASRAPQRTWLLLGHLLN